jgi:hypothetical protein
VMGFEGLLTVGEAGMITTPDFADGGEAPASELSATEGSVLDGVVEGLSEMISISSVSDDGSGSFARRRRISEAWRIASPPFLSSSFFYYNGLVMWRTMLYMIYLAKLLLLFVSLVFKCLLHRDQ